MKNFFLPMIITIILIFSSCEEQVVSEDVFEVSEIESETELTFETLKANYIPSDFNIETVEFGETSIAFNENLSDSELQQLHNAFENAPHIVFMQGMRIAKVYEKELNTEEVNALVDEDFKFSSSSHINPARSSAQRILGFSFTLSGGQGIRRRSFSGQFARQFRSGLSTRWTVPLSHRRANTLEWGLRNLIGREINSLTLSTVAIPISPQSNQEFIGVVGNSSSRSRRCQPLLTGRNATGNFIGSTGIESILVRFFHNNRVCP
jgi:hypothetical protein